MSKFRKGEIVLMKDPGGYQRRICPAHLLRYIDQELEITSEAFVGPSGRLDYEVHASDGHEFYVAEILLRKRPQPGLDHFRSELKSADPSLWPPGIDLDRLRNPAPSESEVRETLKGILQPFDGFEGAA